MEPMSNTESRFQAGLSEESLRSVELVVFDFDGVFTDNSVYVGEDGSEQVRCWRSDGIGLARLRAANVQSYVISTEPNPVVVKRTEKLQLPCRHGVSDKAAVLLEVCAETGVPPEKTMFVGNDVNDIPAFMAAGISVAVADAYDEVLPFVTYRTTRKGGYGAVREICDLICAAKPA
jgi:YrbI family 3-deoxy-D-manno-octulosonate 8-phosphate phosphatase